MVTGENPLLLSHNIFCCCACVAENLMVPFESCPLVSRLTIPASKVENDHVIHSNGSEMSASSFERGRCSTTRTNTKKRIQRMRRAVGCPSFSCDGFFHTTCCSLFLPRPSCPPLQPRFLSLPLPRTGGTTITIIIITTPRAREWISKTTHLLPRPLRRPHPPPPVPQLSPGRSFRRSSWWYI